MRKSIGHSHVTWGSVGKSLTAPISTSTSPRSTQTSTRNGIEIFYELSHEGLLKLSKFLTAAFQVKSGRIPFCLQDLFITWIDISSLSWERNNESWYNQQFSIYFLPPSPSDNRPSWPFNFLLWYLFLSRRKFVHCVLSSTAARALWRFTWRAVGVLNPTS